MPSCLRPSLVWLSHLNLRSTARTRTRVTLRQSSRDRSHAHNPSARSRATASCAKRFEESLRDCSPETSDKNLPRCSSAPSHCCKHQSRRVHQIGTVVLRLRIALWLLKVVHQNSSAHHSSCNLIVRKGHAHHCLAHSELP